MGEKGGGAASQRASWFSPAKVALAEGAGDRQCLNCTQLGPRLQESHRCDKCLQASCGCRGEEEDLGVGGWRDQALLGLKGLVAGKSPPEHWAPRRDQAHKLQKDTTPSHT